METLVSGCQNLLVSNQVSQLRVLGVHVRSCVCSVQPSCMTVFCVGVPLQERGHKDQNLLTLLGKCQYCSKLLAHTYIYVCTNVCVRASVCSVCTHADV